MMFAKNQRSNGPEMTELWKIQVSTKIFPIFPNFDLPVDFGPYGHFKRSGPEFFMGEGPSRSRMCLLVLKIESK